MAMAIAMAIITTTITAVSITVTMAAMAAAEIGEIYSAKPPIGGIIAVIDSRRCIDYCRRWIIHNTRRIIDGWRSCINSRC